jgi:multidrug resistance protein, MATE family
LREEKSIVTPAFRKPLYLCIMNREILRLAIPNILSNISIPLLSTVDTLLMGDLSAVHLGAVGVGAMLFNFVYWNFGFLRMGTTGMTAQAYGAGDAAQVSDVFYRAVGVALGIALLLVLFAVPIANLSFQAMHMEGEQLAMVSTYFFTRLWAAPASLLLYALFGWFFGMQDAISPLLITVTLNICNIACSVVLVKYFGLDIYGVALGTVIAQYVGLALAVGILIVKYRSKLGFSPHTVFRKVELVNFFKLNSDIFIRTFCLTSAFFFFHSQSALGGELVLAINVVLLQLLNWMSYGIDGFAYAAESLVGKYFGAKNDAMTYKAIRYAMFWGGGLALGYAIVFAFGYDTILRFYNDQNDLLQLADQYYIGTIAMPIVAFACYIWDGIFVGLTASKAMRNCMLIAFAMYLVIYYSIIDIFPIQAIWVAMLSFLAIRGLVQTAYFMKYKLGIAKLY